LAAKKQTTKMSRVITASRLSDGNKVFPPKITLEDSGLKVKIPGLFKNNETYFNYSQISSVNVDSPMVGFSTISFNASGTRISVNGLSKSDVREIKEAIESGPVHEESASVSYTNVVTEDPSVTMAKLQIESEERAAERQHRLELKKIKAEEKAKEKHAWNEIMKFDYNAADSSSITAHINIISSHLEQLVYKCETAKDKEKRRLLFTKFDDGMTFLQQKDPANQMISFFTQKKMTWEDKLAKDKRKKIIILLVCITIWLGLIAVPILLGD